MMHLCVTSAQLLAPRTMQIDVPEGAFDVKSLRRSRRPLSPAVMQPGVCLRARASKPRLSRVGKGQSRPGFARPQGEAFTARCSVVVNHDGDGAPTGGPGRLFVVEHSGPHHCCRELQGHSDSDAQTFLRSARAHGVFRPQPGGLIQFAGLAQCGGHTSFAELAPWLCPNRSARLP
jgi:hypothetical protein